MKVITNKEDVIIAISEVADIQKNGIRLDNVVIAIATNGEQFLESVPNIYEVENIPSDAIPRKYCYTKEKGVYLNTDYKELNTEDEQNETLAKQLASLLIENKKKDLAIENLTKTIAQLNIKISQMGGTN